jgi:hypothetical protein
MPQVITVNGFRLYFYSNEHDPAHIHIKKGDSYAKINLATFDVMDSINMKQKELKEAIKIVKENHKICLEAWNEHAK